MAKAWFLVLSGDNSVCGRIQAPTRDCTWGPPRPTPAYNPVD